MDTILWAILVSIGWATALVLALRKRAADQRYNELLDNKLENIRTLVDGTLMASMHSELNALQGQVVLMKRLNDLTKPASDEDIAILEATQSRVAELLGRVEHKEAREQATK
jgi:hypothetical protein